MALRWWLPAAFAILTTGYLLAARVFFTDRPFRMADAVISNLILSHDNPRGWLLAATAQLLCGFLLLPVTTILQERLRSINRWASGAGVWLQRAGLLAMMVMAWRAPIESDTWADLHINLAFGVYVGLSTGLLCFLWVSVRGALPGRGWLAGMALLQLTALGLLAWLFFMPYPSEGYGPWTCLAALEYEMAVAIALTLFALFWSLDVRDRRAGVS